MDEQKVVKKAETIREWYQRTTRRARRGLAWATLISCAVMGLMWAFASMNTLTKLQTFNGALTVPLIGGIWIFAFIFMFLVPSREASFRAQETLEDGVSTLHKLVEEQILPVVRVWERVGVRVEKEYPELRQKIEESVAEIRTKVERLEKAFEENSDLVKDVRPVLAALKRIEDRIEEDLLDDLKLMTEAVKRMSGVPIAPHVPPRPPVAGLEKAADPKPAKEPVVEQAASPSPPAAALQEPDLNATLSRLQSRKKKKEEAAPQPQQP